MSFGLDYTAAPSITTMKSKSVAFVCRYVGYFSGYNINNIATPQGKCLTPGEAKALSQAGIAVVSNYEWYGNRAAEGYSSGVADAQIAQRIHTECGGPGNRPIYFSVDFDTGATAAIIDYFKGVASVIGLDRTGAYGGYACIKGLLDVGAIKWAWQTYAWSSGQWDTRAHIQQYNNGVTLDGHSVDYDRSMKDDFGQWAIGDSMQTYSKNSADFSTFFTYIDDQHIQCKQTKCVIQDAILTHYYQLSMNGQTLPIPGLPRTPEIYITLANGKRIVVQIFERLILCYDPAHNLDDQPGMQDVYLVHIDQATNPGMAQLLKFLDISPTATPAPVDTSAVQADINAIVSSVTSAIASTSAKALADLKKL